MPLLLVSELSELSSLEVSKANIPTSVILKAQTATPIIPKEAPKVGLDYFLKLETITEELVHSTLQAHKDLELSGVCFPLTSALEELTALDALLSVHEADHSLPEGSLKVFIEIGDVPVAAYSLCNAGLFTSRLAGVLWDAAKAASALGAIGRHADAGTYSPALVATQTMTLMGGKALGVPCYDTPERDATADALQLHAQAAKEMGFDGKAAASYAQLETIATVFA
ncbi:hypothetical protein PUV47_11530 [Pseudovibrio exalbescens]|uniref:hypothetical protein n=1 Tax=Pseudovibrio exalbescens TaxID=197461 RepID=UPI0023664141|nr:hypothetical protein [Pseudovibrio exalbescens]MDD7910551.1 hypothetical protein [Pseudovibrio exalbescens]